MINDLHFQDERLMLPIVLAVVLLWSIFIWKEWKPIKKVGFYFNSVIALIVLVSLGLWLLKPVQRQSVKGNPAVLLTNNHKQERLDSLKKVYKNLKSIRYVPNQILGKNLDSVSEVYILGEGLKTYDFWQLDSVPSSYIGKVDIKGIVRLKYNQRARVGDMFTVHLRYSKPQIGNRLLLSSAGATMDSVILKSESDVDFILATPLKVSGKYTFDLVESDSLGKRISSETLPLIVRPHEPLQIAMLNSFPTFETKYLKNYLIEMGHSLTVRSQLTRNNYKFEYFNSERNPIYRLTQNLLAPFDVLILDTGTYSNLSASSRTALDVAVRKNGLGVFIQPDEGFFGWRDNPTKLSFIRAKEVETGLDYSPKLSLDKYAFLIGDEFGAEVIIQKNGNMLTGYKRLEHGRIGTTVLQNTYQLVLDGHTNAYEQLWAKTIDALAKRNVLQSQWEQITALPFPNEIFEFELTTLEENPEVIRDKHTQVALKQSVQISNVYSGITYPQEPGWHVLHFKNDSSSRLDFYVMKTRNWQSLSSYSISTENLRKFKEVKKGENISKRLRPINPFWFFLSAIIGMAYLWAAPKLSRN